MKSKINKLQTQVDEWVNEMETKIHNLGAKTVDPEPVHIDISSQTSITRDKLDVLNSSSMFTRAQGKTERKDEIKD